MNACIGSFTANYELFMPGKNIEGEKPAPPPLPQVELLVKGVFEKRRFVGIILHVMVFGNNRSGNITKKISGICGYHCTILTYPLLCIGNIRMLQKIEDEDIFLF